MATDCRLVVATSPAPGAIAVLELLGDVDGVLHELTGRDDWPAGRARLTPIGGVDEGLVARLDDRVAQLMPHGGPRVVQRLVGRLAECGVEAAEPAPETLYPEAADRPEALMLATLARAASPAAVDVLLRQPARWRGDVTLTDADHTRSTRLNRLITPPVVVVAGPANAGKSTLSNALVGRAVSIAADEPGTTRDYTTGRLDLAGLVVDWHDTPGLRDDADDIERRAVEVARRLMMRADLLIALAEASGDWPTLPRTADLRVGSKADLATRPDADLSVSAVSGEGLATLVTAVRDRLVTPEDLEHPGPWLFDERLVSPPA